MNWYQSVGKRFALESIRIEKLPFCSKKATVRLNRSCVFLSAMICSIFCGFNNKFFFMAIPFSSYFADFRYLLIRRSFRWRGIKEEQSRMSVLTSLASPEIVLGVAMFPSLFLSRSRGFGPDIICSGNFKDLD